MTLLEKYPQSRYSSSHINTSIPLVKRLANFRAKQGYLNYRSASPDYGSDDKGKRIIWFDGVKELEKTWRFTGYADRILNLRHTGYYADNFQEETYRPLVAQLPASRDGHRYLAGYEETDSGTIRLDSDLYESKEDAAHSADSTARYAAEENQEYLAKDSAETQIGELKEENQTIEEDIKALTEEETRVRNCGHTLGADAIKAGMANLASTKEKNEKRIAKLEDNYWAAVE